MTGSELLQDARRERFAQLRVSGKTVVDSHEQAGWSRNRGNASAIAREPDVRSRIEFLTKQAADKAAVDGAEVIRKLRDSYDAAMDNKHYSAAVRAAELLGNSTGMFKQRVEVSEEPSNPRELVTRLKGFNKELGEMVEGMFGLKAQDTEH
jgi:hypothetical protein